MNRTTYIVHTHLHVRQCDSMRYGVAGFADASAITLHRNSELYNDSSYHFVPYCIVQLYLSPSCSPPPAKLVKLFYSNTHTHLYLCVVLDQIKYFRCFFLLNHLRKVPICPLNSVRWRAGWLTFLIRIQATEQTFTQNLSQKSRFNLYFCHCSSHRRIRVISSKPWNKVCFPS